MSNAYDPEGHYHIRSLIEGQEKRSSDRQYFIDKAKTLEEREDMIKQAQIMELMDFACPVCHEDFSCVCPKQVESDWNNSAQRIAFYKGKHKKCGTWCIRLITDKHLDPYFTRSKKVKADRSKYHDDLVQPNEEGYVMLYGKPR